MPMVALMFVKREAKIVPIHAFKIWNIMCKFDENRYNSLWNRRVGTARKKWMPVAAILIFWKSFDEFDENPWGSCREKCVTN